MREITDHHVNECNQAIRIEAAAPDPKTGASHLYTMRWHATNSLGEHKYQRECEVSFPFQHGPVKDGINGITNEVLLAILIDRMRGFQGGQFSCRENALALTKLEEAKHWLEARTKARVARGVEGTRTV